MLDSIYFPSKHLDFSKMFFRIQAQEQRAKYRGEINKTIYLPLPNEIFSQNFTMSYSTENLGSFGESAARNFSSVSNQIRNIFNGNFSSFDSGEIAKKIGEEISSTIETQFKDSLMSGFGSTDNTFGVAMQGLGYTYAPNKTQVFQGVTQNRTFVINWSLIPRNYQDAKNIEEIFRELLRYALPKLEKNILTEKISEILDNFKDASNEVILKVADALGVKHLLEKELKVGDTPEDTSQKATNEDLNYFETLMEIIDPALNVTSDVLGGFIDGTTGGSEFYPTTFEVPNSVKLAIMERTGDDEAKEVKESFHFPYNFYIQQIVSNTIGQNDQNSQFIEFRNENGEMEYFPVGRKLILYVIEERPLTASDYTHRKEIYEENLYQ